MTVAELLDQLARVDPAAPVTLWNDNDGTNGDADYLTTTDGQVTICGRLS